MMTQHQFLYSLVLHSSTEKTDVMIKNIMYCVFLLKVFLNIFHNDTEGCCRVDLLVCVLLLYSLSNFSFLSGKHALWAWNKTASPNTQFWVKDPFAVSFHPYPSRDRVRVITGMTLCTVLYEADCHYWGSYDSVWLHGGMTVNGLVLCSLDDYKNWPPFSYPSSSSSSVGFCCKEW